MSEDKECQSESLSMACSSICEKRLFLLLRMPGLENYLSCLLLFIYYFRTIKDCRRVKLVCVENKGA